MNSIERARKVAVDWMELPLAEDGAIETEALVNLVAIALTETRTKALSEKEAEITLLKTVIGLIDVDLSAGEMSPKNRVALALSRTRAALKAEGGEI